MLISASEWLLGSHEEISLRKICSIHGWKKLHLLAFSLAYKSHGQQRKVGRVRVALFLGSLHSPRSKPIKPVLELVGCAFLSVSTKLYTAGICGFSSIIHQSVLVLRTPRGLTAVYFFLSLHPLHCKWVLYCNHSFPDNEMSWFSFHYFIPFPSLFFKKKNIIK